VQELEACATGQSTASDVCTYAACYKDTGSYAYLLAQKYGVLHKNFQFSACSGANSTGVSSLQVASPSFGNPDVVTVQAGGNDYDTFVNVLTSCVALSNDAICQAAVNVATMQLPNMFNNVKNTLQAINAKVRPTTVKAVVGYAQFFGDDYASSCTVTSAVSSQARKSVNALVVTANSGVASVAADAGFIFVNADPAFAGHRWCDKGTAWFTGSLSTSGTDTGGIAFVEGAFGHPTRDGQLAYVSALEQAATQAC
jgi:hypothetical protein